MFYFVEESSVVRKIWGKSDTVLYIFAGASAEFALNKAVDWLYYTGRLPSDPMGRLFSTVSYARKIVFSPYEEAVRAIESMRKIHQGVEQNRGIKIPEWAYRDVLYMLIHYSVSAYELLEHKLSDEEKEDVYKVFCRIGRSMGLKGLPASFNDWVPEREKHMEDNLSFSNFTIDLFKQYKRQLGPFRYGVLVEAQKLVVPAHVKNLLHLRSFSWLSPVLPLYKFSRLIKMDKPIKYLLFPAEYMDQINELDHPMRKAVKAKCPFHRK